MIRSVAIRNYRSCLDTAFDVHEHLSVLIGPNSSGKTNILSGVLLLRKLVDDPHHGIFSRSHAGQCEIKTRFEIEGKAAIRTAGLDLYTDEHNSDVIQAHTRRGTLETSPEMPSGPLCPSQR